MAQTRPPGRLTTSRPGGRNQHYERQRAEQHRGEDDEQMSLGQARIGAAGHNGRRDETAVLDPVCRNMARSPATAADWSGASCSVALLAAGVETPIPIPQVPAASASQAYADRPPAGLVAVVTSPDRGLQCTDAPHERGRRTLDRRRPTRGPGRPLIWNQAHLRQILRQYEAHYNQHRPHSPHRALDAAAPLKPLPESAGLDQHRVRKQAHVGGLINECRLVA
jgi:hypothetical protein